MPHAAPIDLPAFLDRLRAAGELVEVDSEVDPRLEMAEVHRRVIAADGPALLFKRPRGAAFPAVTNLFGTARRVKLAFGDRPEEIVERVAALPEEPFTHGVCIRQCLERRERLRADHEQSSLRIDFLEDMP